MKYHTKWESDKNQETSHTRESKGQHFPSRWSQRCKEQTRRHNKDKPEIKITKRIHKRSTALGRSLKKLLEGLNMFNGTNLTLNFDVDQDT